ncbi:MAG: anaerobic glycerol-3-phosphate dehydrogenase subunit C [Pirellulales bacterium]|nr:anaerobic glycerol-3-phosphate dehydrogenase subunit C [Pirellulales bacterium]
MDERRARLQEDLRGLLRGEVRCDDIFVQLYASDASLYQVRPLGVVMPRSTDDVVVTMQYAAEQGIPVHARGAGTGLAGESLGPGLVIDFSRFLRRVLEVGSTTVRVQPGVVLARLNDYLRTFGRLFGPDPAKSDVTTMGSVIAIDAGGSRWPRYGSASTRVESLQVVLADGTLLEVGREPRQATEAEAPTRRQLLIDGLVELLSDNASLVAALRPGSRVNRAGYHLAGILTEHHLNLARLLCGSEGTLALITEATLVTDPLPRHRGLAMLFFDRLEAAARAALELVPLSPSACDLMDRRHLSLAREVEARYDALIPPRAEALLLVEHDGNDPGEVRQRLQESITQVTGEDNLAFDSRIALDRDDVDLFWQLSRNVTPNLFRLKGPTRPLPFVEDIAVPPEVLPSFLARMQNVLKQHQVIGSLFAHAAQGQLHLRPFLDPTNPEDVARMEPLARDLYEAVFDVRGSISGEHGSGYSRTPYLQRQSGALYEVFREVKDLFDPLHLLNPGKVISDERALDTERMRPPDLSQFAAAPEPAATPAPALPLSTLQLRWQPGELSQTARDCNGCGACRSQESDVRMCPIFRFAPSEEASPRAKANLVRAVLSGQLDARTAASDEFKAVADLCVNCQMCRLECPSNVDIPRLMVEAKAAYVAVNGQTVRDWLLARLDVLAAIGSRMAPLVNWLAANAQARWLLERSFGLAQGRKLPRYARRTFLRRAVRRRLTRPTRRSGPKVLYFVDTYANVHDPQIGEALVAILEHNGVAVYVHPGQSPSGMSMISAGALEAARRTAEHNVSLLAEAVRQGYHIVATEPAAALCLTYEYPLLVDDADARLVAGNTSEACAYLWNLHRQGQLELDLQPVNAALGYHAPCHMKALQVGEPALNLLRLIPGLTVQKIDKGCSGMAGTFGIKRENFRNSLRAGWGLITSLRHPALQAGTTECSACKIQMEQGANKPTIHPLKLLALSYGLLPEAAVLLAARTEELVVT